MNSRCVMRAIVLVGGLLGMAGLQTVVALARPVSVVATTTIVGDVVAAIGGGEVELSVLIPAGVDPHAFEPTPRDVISVADADIVFVSGAGLEQALLPLLGNSGADPVDLSARIALRTLGDQEDADLEHGGEHLDVGWDPHVWFDPTNVMIWTDEIAEALSQADPDHAQQFADRAAEYRGQLAELDAWIWGAVSRLPREQRRIITDHAVLGYFAARYDFDPMGTVLPGFSSLSEPSAREIAHLQDQIASSGVAAIFVGQTVNPALSQRIATDTGVSLVVLYTGSLGTEGGPASDYLGMMRTNVTNIVNALLGESGLE